MKLIICSVYDSKAKTYHTPFFEVNQATAIRSFATAANDHSTVISRHPEDYTLFLLGTFDTEDASFQPALPAEALGNAVAFKERPTTDNSQTHIEDIK